MDDLARHIGGRTAVRVSFRQRAVRSAAALAVVLGIGMPALLGGGAAVAQAATVGTEPAAIAPADAILYLGLSTDMTSPQWTLANELLQRAGATTDATSLVGDLSQSATGNDAVANLTDMQSLLGGEAAVVVTTLDQVASQASNITDVIGNISVPSVDAAATTNGGFALIVKPGDVDAATKAVAADLDSQASTNGATVEETTYKGVTIRSVAGDPNAGTTGTAYAVVDGFIVLAETAKDIEPVIDTSAGDTPALADLAEFKQADQALAGDRLAFGFIDGSAATSDAANVASGTDATASMGSFDFLNGLSSLQVYTGLAVVADQPGFRLNTVEIPADGAAPSATPGGTAAGLGFADKVPGDSLVFVNGYNLGKGPLLQGLGLLLVTAFSQGFSGAGAGAGADATPTPIPDPETLYQQAAALIGFNLKSDLIDQMTGEYGFALWNVDLNDPAKIGAVLKSDVATPAVLSDSLSKLSLLVQAAAQGQATVTTRMVGDSQVSSVAVGSDPATAVTIEYGVVNDQFLLGVGNGIDIYTGTAGDSLSDNPDYQAALKELPSEYDGIFFVNLPQAIALANDLGSSMGSSTDASSACAQYGSQEEAQAAYDADTITNFDLDTDFDGQACEDYFTPATPVASPVADGSQYGAIRAFAMVSFKQDGLAYTNSILLISEK